MNTLNWLRLTVWIVVFEGVGFVLGLLTQQNMEPWYQSLHKSNLTPPGIAFSIVWPLLYGMLALVGFLLWQERHKPEWRMLYYVFLIQMVMNWLWTPIFFQWHWLGVSLVWISLLTGLVAVCVYLAALKRKEIALLLLPYFVWLSFATYLNAVIWAQN